MKATGEKRNRVSTDFYLTNLAPVNRRCALCFGMLDVAMLTVLFLEVGVLMRTFLAN